MGWPGQEESLLRDLTSDLKNQSGVESIRFQGPRQSGVGGILDTAVNLKQCVINCLFFRKTVIASFCFSLKARLRELSDRAFQC